LEAKVRLSKQRIKEWYSHWDGNVYVAFSGGKDSTVLLHICRSIYPNVPAVFNNTGVEFPEIIKFIKEIDNVIMLKPPIPYRKVLTNYGYPLISKETAEKIYEIRNTNSTSLRDKRLHGDNKGNGKLPQKWYYLLKAPFLVSSKCCDILKKSPARIYERTTKNKRMTGMMAGDSYLRRLGYLKRGCNSFNGGVSNPLGFWKEEDIWNYIKTNNVTYSKIYDMGYNRTGCVGCLFGIHLEDYPNRLQQLKITHPKLWSYYIEHLRLDIPLDFIGVPYGGFRDRSHLYHK
jgi:3'-phosphoadenosine 5'-phosphosulfate sulfotransferase (PAPS reductase)/FAD synthetase